ncbi:MAG: glycosyltransferase family 1 protein [Candidatus Moranbacteria bacterium]|nr:glycosyltransferase family 1 protein [Candidatus Moranbacteria bacterium]
MRIGIDVRCLTQGRRTGVEEYTLNLLENLFALDQENEYVLFFNSFKKSPADFEWLKKYPRVKLKAFRIPNKLLNLSFWYLGWPKIDRLIGGCDIFFMPNIIFGALGRKVKLILTIHDLSFERYPETFSWKRRLWHIFINPKKLCRRADKIIAVSDSTREDVAELYKINFQKLTTIYSGVAEKFQVIDRNSEKLLAVKEKYQLPYKFILYLGTVEPRKNIIGLIRAYDHLQKYAYKNNIEEIKKYKLAIAGQTGWLTGEIFSEIEKSEFKDKILNINFVDEADKEFVYNLASLFVYPSFFEGFGFPVLEAMACGVPVIASNNSSLPEIVGQAGILIDPDRPEEIYEAMKQVLTNKEFHNKLRAEGLKQAKKFSWQKSAKEFLKVIAIFKTK